MIFMRNDETGTLANQRIAGVACRAGVGAGKRSSGHDFSCRHRIILLHSVILSFGGIPLLYNGDALGVLNDYSYLDDDHKSNDNAGFTAPKINWERAELRKKQARWNTPFSTR